MMSRLRIGFVLLICWPTLLLAQPILKIQHWQSKNGVQVYFVKSRQLPMIDINLMFNAGSIYDKKLPGLSALTTNLIGEGTNNLTADQIADHFDQVGAEFSASQSRDGANVQMRSLINDKYFQPALKTYIDVVSQANFPEKAIARVKQQTIAAIRLEEQQPGSIASKAFFATVYKGTPYAHSELGDQESVTKITQTDIKNFYRTYYVGNNAKLVIVGDVDMAKAKQIADQIAGALNKGKQAPTLKQVPLLTKSSHVDIDFPSKQTAIILGGVGIDASNPHYFALKVGNYILGGMPLSSILFEQVRNQRGLAYYAGSSFSLLKYRGPFAIQLKTRANKTKEAVDVVRETLANYIKQGPTDAQLNAAKKNLIGSFPLAIDSNSDILSNVSNLVFYNRPLDFLNTYIAKVKAVTRDDIIKAFQATIDPKHLVTITVGPTGGEHG